MQYARAAEQGAFMEWLKIILSWPVIVAGIAITLFYRYDDEIRSLMRRISNAESVEFSGIKLGKLQSAINAVEDKDKPPPADLELPAPPPSAPNTPVPDGSVVLTQEEWKQVLDMIQSQSSTSAYWEYRYLNYFLVWNTQRTLDWLIVQNRAVTASEVDALLHSLAVNERKAILDALASHHLISIDGALISITDKGRSYVEWRNAQ